MKFSRLGSITRSAALTVVGFMVITACAAGPNSGMLVDRVVYEDVTEIAENSQFSFLGSVDSSAGTWYHPIWEGDPDLNPLVTGDSPQNAEDLRVQMAPIAVTEYNLTVTEPLSSSYGVGEVATVYQMGGPAGDEKHTVEELSELKIGKEYLLFIWDQTDPGYWTITGIDAGIFIRTTSGENWQNSSGITIDEEILKRLDDLGFYSKNIRK